MARKPKRSYTLSDECAKQLQELCLLFRAAGKDVSISGTIELLTGEYYRAHSQELEGVKKFAASMQTTLFDE